MYKIQAMKIILKSNALTLFSQNFMHYNTYEEEVHFHKKWYNSAEKQ